MNWQNEAKYFSKGQEGWSSTIYLDIKGIPTFAWGFNCTNDLIKRYFPGMFKPNFMVSQEQAIPVFDVIYNDSISEAIKYVGKDIWVNLSDNLKIVLSDMCFAMGYPALSKFIKLKDAIISGNRVAIRQEIADSDWARDLPNRSAKLIGMI